MDKPKIVGKTPIMGNPLTEGQIGHLLSLKPEICYNSVTGYDDCGKQGIGFNQMCEPCKTFWSAAALLEGLSSEETVVLYQMLKKYEQEVKTIN